MECIYPSSKLCSVQFSHSVVSDSLRPVKWTLEGITMNKASGGDGISVELLQILKDDAVKVLHSVMEHSAIATGLQKVFFFFFLPPYQRKAMPKNAQIITQLHSSHTLVMLKILQARPQQYVNHDLPEVQASFSKG